MSAVSAAGRRPSGRQRLMSAVIRGGRRALGGTPLGGSRLTRSLSALCYRAAFAGPSGTRTAEIPFRGLRFAMADGDRCMAPLLADGRYERLQLEIYERFAAESAVVFDVGANIGLYTCTGAVRQPDGGRVFAFEPAPANVAALRRNAGLNGCAERVHIEAAAVGAGAGVVELALCETNGAVHTVATDGPSDGGLSVQQVTLDGFSGTEGAPAPDVIKIDTEGYEAQVLRGAEDCVRRAEPALFVEFLPRNLRRGGADPAELLEALYADGRRVFAIDEACGELRRAERWDLEVIETENLHCANLLSLARPEHDALLPQSAWLPWGCAR